MVISSQLSARPSNMPGAKFNQTQPFGSLGKNVMLTKAIADNKTNTTLLFFDFSNGSETSTDVINWDNVKVDFKGDHWLQSNPPTKAEFIPTSNNTGVIKLRNVKNKYQDFQIIFNDKQIDSSKIMAVSNGYSNDQKAEVVQAKFVINRDTPKTENINSSIDQKTLAISENNVKQDEIDKLIKHNQQAIKDLKKSDKQVSADIQALKNQKKISTEGSDVENIDTQITTKQDVLSESSNKKATLLNDIQDQKLKRHALGKQLINLKKGKLNLHEIIKY
ncbi:hypothetical protein IV73_GL001051 [Weissella kandleri]|uniref:Uncharacterized protein n=2 Tax=Weissella kandleri TaxID=1616 RepID=A0A0R2JKE9_9LACO|nr:hypothetical protein IV73_GL001051 [Weissella kandleri]